MRAESDAEIVSRTLAGNRHAFEALILRYNRMAYAVAFARVGNHQDAEDAVQESWIQAFTTLDRLRERDRFAAWLASIVRNVSLNATRNRWRRTSLDDVGGDLMVDYRKPMEDADVHRALWTHVEAMSPEHREVLTLHYHAGMSTEEIAEWSGVPREAVKKRLQRARTTLSEQTLKTLFEPAEREEEDRRKRVMAALLILPLDWRVSPIAASHRLTASKPKTIQFLGREWTRTEWLKAGLGLAVGAVLLWCIVTWLSVPRPEPIATPQARPVTQSSNIQINSTGGKGGPVAPPAQSKPTPGTGKGSPAPPAQDSATKGQKVGK
ncbi:MAG: sigma-70 family RNA polymerase sigma factor [Candidatus Hydrogenedentes bacterium]|nr:sigma-70 family RNA polymerase sigma factor [Candidatus Hydrogenedentota bacterium]